MDKAGKYPIPKDAFDDRISIVGMSGSGKTYAASGAVEHLLDDGARAVIVDPLGVWYGLRLQKGGKLPSRFDIPIFGGPRGDIALTEQSGSLIGETVAGMAQSCILDLSQIGTRAGERRFMLAFLTALYRGINGTQIHVVFDEADMWAPQRLLDKDGDAAKLLGTMETIVRRGRARGFIPWLITQRPAVLSKDVLSQSDGIVALKLTASQDRDAIGAWIEGQADRMDGKAILASLPSLDRGSGVVWFPSRNVLDTVQFPLKETFDSSRAPKRGEARQDAVLKPLDIGALRQRLATVEAETKANDPKALKAEIGALKRDLAAKPSGADPKAVEQAYANGLAEGLARGENRAKAALKAVQDRVDDAAAVLRSAIEGLDSPEPTAKRQPSSAAPVPRATTGNGKVIAGTSLPAGSADGLTTPQRRVMASLAFWRSVGQEQPTREQVAAIAGYRPGSGNFNNIIGSLSTAGQTKIPAPGCLSLAVQFEPLAPSEAEAKLWSVFDNPQRRLVEAAMQHATDDMTREELATAAGYAPGSGNFNNITGSLTTMDVLQRSGTGRVALSPWAREVLS